MFDPVELLKKYAVPDRAPRHVRVNFISSLDGAATHNGLSGPLNNAADKQVFDLLRMLSDVVLVGAGTLRIEDYGALRLPPEAVAWRLSQGLSEHPVLAVVSARLDLDPLGAPFSQAPVRPLVFTVDGMGDRSAGGLGQVAEVIDCGVVGVVADRMLQQLEQRGLNQILCEGGPRLFGSLITADAVDELCLTLAPTLEGGTAQRISTGEQQRRTMQLVHSLSAEDTLILRYLRRS